VNNWSCVHYRPCEGEEYAIGPDKEPYPGWCEEVVNATSLALNGMIALVPREEVRNILTLLVESLAKEGLRCCATGGIWKSCVGPLAKKLHIWMQKWKLFGIPPDPAWE
jgi:hypothetical protein